MRHRHLVPIDLSDNSLVVLDRAIELAVALKASVVLVHAIDVPTSQGVDVPIQAPGSMHAVSLGGFLREQAALRLRPAVQRVEEAGLACEVMLEPGPPAEVVLEALEKSQASMVIMGTHARKGLGRLVLGSVAENVVRRANVPVVTVRANCTTSLLCDPA